MKWFSCKTCAENKETSQYLIKENDSLNFRIAELCDLKNKLCKQVDKHKTQAELNDITANSYAQKVKELQFDNDQLKVELARSKAKVFEKAAAKLLNKVGRGRPRKDAK